MTPATNAIIASLPRAKQASRQLVNDTARELGAAFGVAVLGSAFNTGYRNRIDTTASWRQESSTRPVKHRRSRCSSLTGFPTATRSLPAMRDSFTVGMRYAVISARRSCSSCAVRMVPRSDRTEETEEVVEPELPLRPRPETESAA
jgi:hypothetical protein